MDNLANALSLLGRRPEAEKLLREILAIRLQKFGAHTPETANTAYNLSCVLALEKRRDEALRFLHQSVDYGLAVRTALAIEGDADLKSLRSDPRFRTIVLLAKQRAQAEQGSEQH
jgi:Tetratricopeptide repeat